MAVIVSTSNPAALLAAIKKSIDNGQIKTWIYNKSGDFTHNADQWLNKALLRPYIPQNTNPPQLVFGLIGPPNVKLERVIIGVYHGRFIEMLVTHFNTQFTFAFASGAKIDDYDSYL